MTNVSRDLSHRVEAALRAALPSSALVAIEGTVGEGRVPTFAVRVRDESLRVAWVPNAWLSVVDSLLDASPPDVVVADRVPPASRERLAASGVGWVETNGAAHIETGSLMVSRTSSHPRPSHATESWTPAVLGVGEAILSGVPATVSATRHASGLSEGACTRALRALTDLGLLESDAERGRHSRRRVSDPDVLLDAYTEAAHHLQPALTLSVGVVWRDPVEGLVEIGRLWDDQDLAWVATGLVAASVVAPHVTSVGTADVYVPGTTIAELEMMATAVGLRPIDGGRLVLSPFPTRTTLHMATMVDGLRVPPWPRLVADLRRSGVRGEDAAEQVKEVAGDG